MKQRDKQELRVKKIEEIRTVLKNVRQELLVLKRDMVQNKLKNTTMLTLKRKEIAVLQTVLKEKELMKNG